MEIGDDRFDAWLRERMAARGSSGPTLARKLGLPTQTVYRWLHGLALPSEALTASLAEALGTTIGEVRRWLNRRSTEGLL